MKKVYDGIERLRAARLASPEHKKRLEYMRAYCKTEKYRASHREYMREERAYRRELRVCVTCGKQDAFANFTRCADCLEREVLKDCERKERRNAEAAEARQGGTWI